jgi:hypothetical protein
MLDEELLQLSPAEVVAHVRRLEARIAELEAELARPGGPPVPPQLIVVAAPDKGRRTFNHD